MKLYLYIDYYTQWGQTVYITGSTKELGQWNEDKAKPMQYIGNSQWIAELDINDYDVFEYKYLIKENSNILRNEAGFPHKINKYIGYTLHVRDSWQDKNQYQHLYTSGFTNSFFAHSIGTELKLYSSTILLNVKCPIVDRESELCISGSSQTLGEWEVNKALKGSYQGDGTWSFSLDRQAIDVGNEYKFLIRNNSSKELVEWEKGENRKFQLLEVVEDSTLIENLEYRLNHLKNWKAAGVAIPVFSLRSESSCGVGDFLDLQKMIDWAAATNLKVIQILPINDTTSTLTNADSYPYSAISIYALHPIYIGLSNYPLNNKLAHAKYLKEFASLNKLEKLDYENTIKMKLSYLKDLYAEIGSDVLSKAEYKSFTKENEYWLFPYASFCYLRDTFGTAEVRKWGEYSVYNEYKINKLTSKKEVRDELKFTYFCQFLLHKQLTDVRNYAHKNGVILKGDIPIGVDPNSVDVWVEPHLFNLDTQTGAPPDDFAEDGQNWGFPTYNWDEMSKDGYQWWIRRFQKMADYFDAYRIDHILGFFRIWEIPSHSIHGLLGYFNPALPYSVSELNNFGFDFDELNMINPYISDEFLDSIFGEISADIKLLYLDNIGEGRYKLKDEFNTQIKIKKHFEKISSEKSDLVRLGLYQLCNDVLFVKDKYHTDKYHPRISAYKTYAYKSLSENNRYAYDQLYNHFFYHRHNYFWQENAMKKLPNLISATRMLTCGEDLGMIPDCVPLVMNELQILSLEIERMPKTMTRFADLTRLPYLSVCTTSTHDMSPIREWWQEDRSLTQQYYNEILHQNGDAPEECTIGLCEKIIINHLSSPSMLTILPLQDWLSMDEANRKADAFSERINVPADPHHYWGYRMHINIEKLISNSSFNDKIKNIVNETLRNN